MRWGAIAGALETFRQAALGKIALENLLRKSQARGGGERLETQRDRRKPMLPNVLRIAPHGLAAGLKQLAAGDLTVALNEPVSRAISNSCGTTSIPLSTN